MAKNASPQQAMWLTSWICYEKALIAKKPAAASRKKPNQKPLPKNVPPPLLQANDPNPPRALTRNTGRLDHGFAEILGEARLQDYAGTAWRSRSTERTAQLLHPGTSCAAAAL